MDMKEVAARVEIHDLLNTYTINTDFGVLNQKMEIWTEDALVVPPFDEPIRGRKKLEERGRWIANKMKEEQSVAKDNAEGSANKPTFWRHNNTSSLIEFQGEEHATGITYFIMISDTGIQVCGTYLDKFRKENGSWLICERKVKWDYTAENSSFSFLRDSKMAEKA